MAITIMGPSAQAMSEGLVGRRALRAGILLGLIAGLADGIAVLIENPNSLSGLRSPAAFVAASVAMHLVLGGAFGGLLALTGIARRISATTFLAVGLGLFLFLWVAIRVHVRWFFGEPLTSMKSLPGYAGVFLGALLVAAILARLFRRPIEYLLMLPLGKVALVSLIVCGFFIVLARPHSLLPRAVLKPPDSARDILFITMDTTRADHLSCYGYPRGTTPALDRLARRGLLYVNAYAPIPLTAPSHASMFTGVSPEGHGVRNNGMILTKEMSTFVESLAEVGWNCAAFVSGIPLKAATSGLSRGFQVYDDRFSVFERIHPMMTTLAFVRGLNRVLPFDLIERRSVDTADAAIRWLEQSKGPRFLWVHFFDAHSPYDAAPIVRKRFSRESEGWTASGKNVDEWPIADYDAEVGTVDHQVSRVLDAFERVTNEEGAVLVTADHGEGLEQHGELTHGQLLFDEDLRVPFIVSRDVEWPLQSNRPSWYLEKNPGIDPRFFDLRLIPIWMKRIAELETSIPKPSGEGPSTMGWYPNTAATYAPEGREDKGAVWEIIADDEYQVLMKEGLTVLPLAPEMRYTPRRKMIMNWARGEEVAFDLWVDPGETKPINTEIPSGDFYPWKDLRNWIPQPASGKVSIDPEVERRLKSLGYIHD
jgi:hypothetical protein